MNVVSILFGLMSVFVLVTYTLSAASPYVIGQNLVSAEINLGILQVKPITLFMYLFFLSYCFGLSFANFETENVENRRPSLRVAICCGMVLCNA